jgi:3-hydroxyisobutyrate dehydrogenase
MAVSFLGLGHMGEPMALNLLRSGADLIVWNRSEVACSRLREAGAKVARSASEAMEASETVILMLAHAEALDAVLGRNSSQFRRSVRGRTIVQMGTTSPQFSIALEKDIGSAGGAYVEAPVSGSRVPAQEARLVVMLAGDKPAAEQAQRLVSPMCSASYLCGPVPNALLMKLAVNLYLITMVTGLVEAWHFASNHHLDLGLVRDIVAAGPMSSDVARGKLEKLVVSDLSAQASLRDVLMNNALVAGAARSSTIATPLLDECHRLYAEAAGMGLSDIDMVGVLGAFEELTASMRMRPSAG